MGIVDGQFWMLKRLDKRQQNADISPIAGLALPRDAGIGTVGPGADVLPLSPVARGRSAPSSTAHPMPRIWIFCSGWMSVMPRPQFACAESCLGNGRRV